MNKNQNWFNILMIILQNFTKKSQILKLVLCDWIECEYSEFTNQSSFQSNSDSYIDWVENTWLIMKAMNISIDILNCLTRKMNEFERQQIQSSQYWVWICDLWTFYHLFWNKMKETIWWCLWCLIYWWIIFCSIFFITLCIVLSLDLLWIL